MEAYLEDNRPTIDEICESYDKCNEECPSYKFCHPQEESEEISDRNMKMWEEIFKAERENNK